MFTGIITDIGTVRSLAPLADASDMRLVIATGWPDAGAIPVGASIACAGCCLTAVDVGPDWFAVEVSGETLSKTGLGRWAEGSRMNLERSLKVGDELGGHFVSGHVDGQGRVVSIAAEAGSHRVSVAVPTELARYIARKGSVAIDGVSLTVNEVDGATFGVNIIPHTWTQTTLGGLQADDAVHIEIDTLARYVARAAEVAGTP